MFNLHRAITRVLAAAAMTLLTMSFVANARAADDSEEARSVTLQYHSRDLDTLQGASILYRRIRAAATSVCSPFESRALERKSFVGPMLQQCGGERSGRGAQRNVERLSWAVHPRLEATTSRSPGIPRGLTVVRINQLERSTGWLQRQNRPRGDGLTAVRPCLETRFGGCRSAASVYLLQSPNICTLRARPKHSALP